MKQNGKASVVMMIICALFLSSCAVTQKPPILQNLQEQGIEIRGLAKLPDQVIVYRETDVAGFTIEYGVLRLKTKGENDLVLEYVDPAEKLVLSQKDMLVYFKADVFNPTGKLLDVTQETFIEEQFRMIKFNGGNNPHTTYYFYVRIPQEGETIKSKIILQLQDSESFIETLQLVCKFKQQHEQERGGDD